MLKLSLTWTKFLELSPVAAALSLPDQPGVFRLSTYNPTIDARVVFYVGESHDIRSDVTDLFKNTIESCIGQHLWTTLCYVRYTLLSSQSEREAVVRFLYQQCAPSCNDSFDIPNAPQVSTNFE